MATMMIQLKVKSFAEWKKVYDSVAGLRASWGALSDQVYHETADPNKVIVLSKWDSLANGQKWSKSAELKAAMEKAGVEGPPSFTFLDEA
jgi:heme-degrading monooxygenase HmoA